jgi:hypothetical protein
MLLISGSKWRETPLGQVQYHCRKCGKTKYHTALVRRARFTLFFIPLFTFRTDYFIACNVCGIRSQAVNQLLAQLREWSTTGQFPVAIGAGV